jgi:transposase-like protein
MKEKSTGGIKRRKYDASFKEEVLRMICNGRPVSEVAREPGRRREFDLQVEEPQQPTATASYS